MALTIACVRVLTLACRTFFLVPSARKTVRITLLEFVFRIIRSYFVVGQLMAVYAALLMIFALMLELNCFIMEAGGFTYPVFVKLFRRYGILHFFSVLFIMVSAGLWFGFSEKLEAEMKDHPQYRGSKVHFRPQ